MFGVVTGKQQVIIVVNSRSNSLFLLLGVIYCNKLVRNIGRLKKFDILRDMLICFLA